MKTQKNQKTYKLVFTPKQESLSKIFNKVPEKLLEGYDDLTLSSKILLCVIYNGAGLNDTKHDREKGVCGFSNQVLQRKTGLSERTISTSLKQLEDYGIIKRKTTSEGIRHIKVLIDLTQNQPWETEAIEKFKETRKQRLLALFENDHSSECEDEDDDLFYY